MEIQSNSFYTTVLGASLAAVCSSSLMADQFSNSSVLNSSAILIGGTNDIVAVWDGRLNTQADISNGTLQENMFIQSASNMPFFGFPPAYHDVHVFGPGNYSFDTCPGTLVNSGGPLGYIAEDGSTNCDPSGINDLSLIVGPGQLGVHLLMDWNASQNIDVAVVWDINGQFPADQLYVGPAGVAPSPDTIWSLVSVDGDADGIPGIAMVDGPFGAFSWNLNLNIPPQSIGINVQPYRYYKHIRQSSEASVPVAIVSRDALDATRVDPATIVVSDPTGRLTGTNSNPSCHDKDVNGDGLLDRVCKVEMSIEATGAYVLRVDADTVEGLKIRGEESIRVVP